MAFARPAPGDIPAGIQPGQTVYVVTEELFVSDPFGGNVLNVEAVHLSREGAEGNLEPYDTSGLRRRAILAVEIQP